MGSVVVHWVASFQILSSSFGEKSYFPPKLRDKIRNGEPGNEASTGSSSEELLAQFHAFTMLLVRLVQLFPALLVLLIPNTTANHAITY